MSLVIIKADRRDYIGDRLDPSALQVGDRVAWLDNSNHYSGSSAVLATVTRFTRTQIIVETVIGTEYRFKRDSGAKLASWSTYLVHPDDPRVIRARVLATQALESIRERVSSALERMARLLTEMPEEG
jgi:hypothetical protein